VEAVKQETEGRQMPLLKKSQNIATYKKENIKDGDYVYAPDNLLEGVYFKGGVIIDFK